MGSAIRGFDPILYCVEEGQRKILIKVQIPTLVSQSLPAPTTSPFTPIDSAISLWAAAEAPLPIRAADRAMQLA